MKRLDAKLLFVAKTIGKKILDPVLLLYFVYRSEKTPKWAKGLILAAIGYFIAPVDLIPDPLPVIGLFDDLAVLTTTLAAVKSFVTEDIRKKAKEKIRSLLK